jgi:hypothetical protein
VTQYRLYLNHVAGYDHVPSMNGAVPIRRITPYQSYLNHVAGYDHVYGR